MAFRNPAMSIRVLTFEVIWNWRLDSLIVRIVAHLFNRTLFSALIVAPRLFHHKLNSKYRLVTIIPQLLPKRPCRRVPTKL